MTPFWTGHLAPISGRFHPIQFQPAMIISNRKWNINSIQNLIAKIQRLIAAIEIELELLTS